MYDQIYKNKIAEQSKYKTYYDLKHEQIKFDIDEKVIILFDVRAKALLSDNIRAQDIINNYFKYY